MPRWFRQAALRVAVAAALSAPLSVPVAVALGPSAMTRPVPAVGMALTTRSGPSGFLGLTYQPAGGDSLAEGATDYSFALRPISTIRAVMLFARFPDATRQEEMTGLYNHLAPQGIAYMRRASYGKVRLTIDPVYEWIPMDHPSTWPSYNQRTFEGHRSYIQEAAQKIAARVDFRKYDIVYIVGAFSPGCPMSPTFGSTTEDAPKVDGAPIRHAVTFGNDSRGANWGWQVLAHETGHIFGLPDLYSYDRPTGRYKDIQRHVGPWDLMGFVATGHEYLAWHKRKLEWLSDDDFRVVAQGVSTVIVAPIYARRGVRAIVAPISDSEAYVVEVRARYADPKSACGVLAYRVDLKRASGYGPISILPREPDSGDPGLEKTHITLYNALYQSGSVVDDAAAHVRIVIVGRAGRGFRLRVSR